MSEPQKRERLGFPHPTLFPVDLREPAKLDQPRFLRMNFQPELRQPLLKVSQEALGFGPMLKPDHEIIGVADENHVALRHFLAPDLCPQVENVMQVNVSQQWREDCLNAKDNLGRGPLSAVRELVEDCHSSWVRISALESNAGS